MDIQRRPSNLKRGYELKYELTLDLVDVHFDLYTIMRKKGDIRACMVKTEILHTAVEILAEPKEKKVLVSLLLEWRKITRDQYDIT